MTFGYNGFNILPADSREQRMNKLYRGICSIGEQLYCDGSMLGDINKRLLAMEQTVADARREVQRLREVKPMTQTASEGWRRSIFCYLGLHNWLPSITRQIVHRPRGPFDRRSEEERTCKEDWETCAKCGKEREQPWGSYPCL